MKGKKKIEVGHEKNKHSCLVAFNPFFSSGIRRLFHDSLCTYIAEYLLKTDDEYSGHHDHIWVVFNALNNSAYKLA